jgi:hypothetical protein
MIARRPPLLAAALLCAALIAGCGSSSSTTSTSTPVAPAATTTATTTITTATTTSAPSTSTASTTPTSPITSADLAAAVAECKAIAQKATTLSGSLKGKVEGICNKAAHGDVAAARAAANEVCIEVINASPIPEAEKTQALAACKAS